MNTLIDKFALILGVVAAIYVISLLLVYFCKFLIWKYETIKVVKSRNKRLKNFYELVRKNHKELKPFLEDLDYMIYKMLDTDLTQQEKNLILNKYHFYKDILERIAFDSKIAKSDLLEFAQLHVEYNNIVREFKKATNNEFYEQNNFLDINLN